MQGSEQDNLVAAIAALQGQRAVLGDAVLEQALAPLRARLAALQRPAGLQLRQVTVLFADVVGSTALVGTLEAEDTLEVLGGALRRMASVIEAHGGRVLRFTGDGVKAAFGADETREDDAARALRAGLAILQAGREHAETARRERGIADFAVRVGVHTGDVALGAGIEADGTAMGAAVHIAARMEQSAPPGALRISHDTWNHVRGLFDVEPQPPLLVKGVDAPMQTYLVRAALDQAVASVERGLQGLATPLVGRDAELQQLLQAVAAVRAGGGLQAVTLVGDAGLGKSRLLRELQAATPDVRVLGVRSQPDGALRPWGVLRGLLATQFGVADTDSADSARRKVVEGLAPWFDEHAERQAQLIGQLSGLDFGDSVHVRGLEPRSLRDQAFGAIGAWLRALAAGERPLLLLVEDLHWADEGSLDLLQHLCAHGEGLSLALVMTARPALLTRRPGWGAGATLLQLAPLAEANSQQLMRALLQPLGTVPAPLAELVVGRAEGNPYYMEELVRRLIDDHVIEVDGARWTLHEERLRQLRLPGTLVGLLQARLDALPPAERQAARQASIVGHVFWDDALQALDADAPQALPSLQRAAFVRPHAQSDFEGTRERQFDHHLLHQVTYDTLLKAERRLGHGAAARWLVERTKGRGAEFLAMTGEHAERAGDTALAIDCFVQAGKEARKRFANTAAVSWLRRALSLLGDAEPARRFELLQEIQGVGDAVGDRLAQEAALAEMATLMERHPDDQRQSRLWFLMAMLSDRRGDRSASELLCRRACELAERCAAAETAALAHGLLIWLNIAKRQYELAHTHVEPAMAWAARVAVGRERSTIEGRLLTLSAMTLRTLSRYEEATQTLRRVLALAETLGALQMEMGALDNLAILECDQGRWGEAITCGERMLERAQMCGNLPYVVRAQWRLAHAARQRGDDAAALQWCERMLPTARIVGDRTMEAVALRQIGNVRRGRGEVAAGVALLHQARAIFVTAGETLFAWECVAGAALGELALQQHNAACALAEEILDALRGPLGAVRARDTMGLRLDTVLVLQGLDDARAAALLERVHADVQAELDQLTASPEARLRVAQDHPTYRAVLEAYARGSAGAPAAL
jgi:class 3 adenylate cyclase/tetratricopeptide (TPR) repeat protein